MDTKRMGNKIAEARRSINLSQAQLAQQLFISPQAVGKWERGESVPDIITVNRLAEILGVDLNYFSEQIKTAGSATEIAAISQPLELPAVKAEHKRSWDMSGGNWTDADFSGLKNLHEKFSSSNMQRCKFIGANLSGLLLKDNHVDSCDFSEAQLSSSHFQHAHMACNHFRNASLYEAKFSGCHLKENDFTHADLTGAVIKATDFTKNTVLNAVLNQTSFTDTYIKDIVFEGTIEDCSFENCSFSRVIFQNTQLINTFFKGNNLKRIKFIDCRADRLTYEFLKSGKADVSEIKLIG
jgi:uncharacterized protein YjbI with pentapeptide repeats